MIFRSTYPRPLDDGKISAERTTLVRRWSAKMIIWEGESEGKRSLIWTVREVKMSVSKLLFTPFNYIDIDTIIIPRITYVHIPFQYQSILPIQDHLFSISTWFFVFINTRFQISNQSSYVEVESVFASAHSHFNTV